MRDQARQSYAEERIPRYTSYPTAPHFTGAIGADSYTSWLSVIPLGTPVSLYLHVPFCRAMCLYCGCHTNVSRRDDPLADYVAVLRREIELVSERIPHRVSARHIHFGGGTPTLVPPVEMARLMETLRRCFAVDPQAELAIEIDPRTLTREMTALLGELGFTRASIGVQSFDPHVQLAIRRAQSFDETATAVRGLRGAGVAGINFDILYGLPFQTVQSCIDTVERCLVLKPDRLSVFGYAHVPGFKKHQRKIDERTLPDGDERHAQAEAIARALVGAGYRRVGLDHFALPGDPMVVAQDEGRLRRNFQGYTTDSCDTLIGFGASAIGRLAQGFTQNGMAVRDYVQSVGRGMPATARGYAFQPGDLVRADVIERVMCDFQVDLDQVGRRHGVAVQDLLDTAPRLQALQDDGMIRIEDNLLTVEEDARLLVRSVAAAFDAYLGQSGRTHSRAV